jgi:hypothetical protein
VKVTKNKRILNVLAVLTLTLGGVSPVSAAANPSPRSAPDTPNSLGPARFFTTKITAAANHLDDVSLVMVDGYPWVAFYDDVARDLVVAHALPDGTTGNCAPNHDWQCDTIQSTGDVGQNPSIAYFPGSGPLPFNWKIGVTYKDNTPAANRPLMYTYYHCSFTFPRTCGWTAPVEIGINAAFSSLKYDSTGHEYVAMYVRSNDSVYVTSPLLGGLTCTPDPTVQWKCVLIDTLGSGNGVHDSYVSLDMNSADHPSLAYFDPVNHNLRFADYVSSGGSCGAGNWNCMTIESGGPSNDPGKGVILHMPKTNQAQDEISIAYYEGYHGELMLAQHIKPGFQGNCGQDSPAHYAYSCFPVAVMGAGITDPAFSMAADPNGYLYLAFYAATLTGAPITLASPNLTGSGSCQGGYLYYQWDCTSLEHADGANTFWSPAMALYPNGKVGVIYAWHTQPDNLNHLGISRQGETVFIPVVQN